MAPIGTDDTTTAELETPTLLLPTVRAGTWPERTPWHQRSGVALVAGLVGIVGLITLAVSVVTVSDDSIRPSSPPPTTTSTQAPVTSTPPAPLTTAPPL